MTIDHIYKDMRGSISILKGFNKTSEITIFRTKAGFARGGCIHNIHDEHSCVIEGMAHYVIGDENVFLTDGGSVKIPKKTPHYFLAITDCVVLEWGAILEEKQEKHPEFRKKVDEINKKKEQG